MLRGINSGERDKVESLIDPQLSSLPFQQIQLYRIEKSVFYVVVGKERKKKASCICVGFELKIRKQE